MNPTLPPVQTEAELSAFFADAPAVDTALSALTIRRSRPEPFVRFAGGSVLVAASGDEVVKVFPPMERVFADTEWGALCGLDGRLPVATPRPRERFEIDGWHGIAMDRLPGRELAEVWPELSRDERIGLGVQLGETLRVLHGTTPPGELPVVDWPGWVAERRANVVEQQRKRRCPDAWLGEIPGLLDAVLPPEPTGWVHTEVMLEHLLVRRTAAGWKLSGLFDFEPSWVAPIAYELPSIGLFVARGDRAVFRAILTAMGARLDEDLPERCLRMALVHRYCNLRWYGERIPPPPGASLRDCAPVWFGV